MRRSFGGIAPYFDDDFDTETAEELDPFAHERHSTVHFARYAECGKVKIGKNEKPQKIEENQENAR